jgi:hypothetical protein
VLQFGLKGDVYGAGLKGLDDGRAAELFLVLPILHEPFAVKSGEYMIVSHDQNRAVWQKQKEKNSNCLTLVNEH